MPSYMAQLLDQLGWNKGTRIPLANSNNQNLETFLIARQTEIQHLKEDLIALKQKQNDLNNYKEQVHSEYQENTRLLLAHKQQMEQEVKLKQLSMNEADRLDRDIINCKKNSNDIMGRCNRTQNNISRLLKNADTLKIEVCGERGALQEWRASLERNAGDITAIEQFTKQDVSKAKELETRRQKLKMEHDRMQDRLNQLCSNLNAEERACDKISIQVMEGMEQRKQMMSMWAAAVENLRQRDKDIRHTREDYALLEEESKNMSEQCRERQAFCDQQHGNNLEAEREIMSLMQQLSRIRQLHLELVDQNLTVDSEVQATQRVLSNLKNVLEKLHSENRHIMDEQYRKDIASKNLNEKLRELKEKKLETLDKSKSAEKRAKELEDLLNDEERYASQVTANQQRSMHCSFIEQKKLLALKNEEKLYHVQMRASKAVMSKLDSKQHSIERNLLNQKESLYAVSYQVEVTGARVIHMEGAQAEREFSAELVEREKRLQDVAARHAARVALLERHSAKLQDDMRRMARDLESQNVKNSKMHSRLKSTMLNVENGDKDLKNMRDCLRKLRVEEALMRLRVAHAARAVAGLDDTAFTLDKQHLQLDSAMNERLIEIATRKDIFSVQRRAFLEDCGKLRSDIREREQRIEQLKKRYDIFIASLGKDDSGQQLSVTFFKIKFAAERAELRERGASLDVDIGKCERDISALEATLQIMHAAHKHFIHSIAPLKDDTPEIQELQKTNEQYYELRDEYKQVSAQLTRFEECVNNLSAQHTLVTDKHKQLKLREVEAENEYEGMKERLTRQESQLYNSKEIVRTTARRARKYVDIHSEWHLFKMDLWIRHYAEAAYNALRKLVEICSGATDVSKHFGALVTIHNLEKLLPKQQRRLHSFIHKIVADIEIERSENYCESKSSSVSSIRSGVSDASGYTRKMIDFRRKLAMKIQEPTLVDEIPEKARRSSVSLRVVTLGFEDLRPEDLNHPHARKSGK